MEERMEVYINDVAAYLPNDPVDNDHIEEIVGRIHNLPSRIKRRILNNNKIERRHYAINPTTGALTHTNAQLTALAIKALNPYPGFTPDDIQCLCCGTTMADLLAPGHGLMVHGELGNPPCEVISTSGICLSGIAALKYAYMNVALALSDNAVATGSELASSLIRANFFEHLKDDPEHEKTPVVPFESEFLRWMVSDAAGAVFLSRKANSGRKSLRVDWIDHISYASRLETCMYAGGMKNEDGSVTGWRQLDSQQEALDRNYLSLKQDTGLLNQEIVKVAVDWALAAVIEKRGCGQRTWTGSSPTTRRTSSGKSSSRPWTASASAFPPKGGSRTWPGRETPDRPRSSSSWRSCFTRTGCGKDRSSSASSRKADVSPSPICC
jgi:3-oxoacyl-[acyl-carrier-protein] synthase-3